MNTFLTEFEHGNKTEPIRRVNFSLTRELAKETDTVAAPYVDFYMHNLGKMDLQLSKRL